MARAGKRGTVKQDLVEARDTLRKAEIWDGWLDAEALMAHVLGKDRAWLHGHPERPLSAGERRRFRQLTERRAAHVPLAYLTGEKEFYGRLLRVSPAVLIPRPETELVVDLALEWLRDHPRARRVIDVGTGSGAIAIAIAKAVPAIRVTAIDTDRSALRVAAANVAEHRVLSRIELRHGDLLAGAPPADLIAANLPYLSAARRRSGARELSFEPVRALDGGRDGLDAIRRAIAQAPPVIRPGGCLLFECDPLQSKPIAQFARRIWPAATVTVHKDLAARDRVVQIQL